MGTGKTVVSKLLAEQLGWSLIDTDELIVKQAGKAISQIFAEDGEVVFRQLESDVLADLQNISNQVISTGGGIILKEENRQLLKKLGRVILLEANPQTIIARLSDDTSRPLLQGSPSEKLERIEKLLETRKPFYTKCADLVIDTTELSLEEIVGEITINEILAP